MNPTKEMLAKAKKTRIAKENKDKYLYIDDDNNVYVSEGEVFDCVVTGNKVTRYKVTDVKRMVVTTKLELA